MSWTQLREENITKVSFEQDEALQEVRRVENPTCAAVTSGDLRPPDSESLQVE